MSPLTASQSVPQSAPQPVLSCAFTTNGVAP